MLDEFVEVMIAYYESELDMNIDVLPGSMIRHRIFRTGSKFEEYLDVYAFVSNQTKGFYVNHIAYGETTNKINAYEVPELIKQWDKEGY